MSSDAVDVRLRVEPPPARSAKQLQQQQRGSPTDIFAVADLARALAPEVDDEGNHEYKRHLCAPSPTRFEELVTQLQWRISEGGGEALYEIGVDDDGSVFGLNDEDMDASIHTLTRMADALACDVSVVSRREVMNARGKSATTALVRRRLDKKCEHLEIRITTLGNVDSGKSTMLGVLTKGGLDNGRGLARGAIFKHKHELETGRTSAVATEILGFHADGSIANYSDADVRDAHQLRWEQIATASSKVIHFSDLCGHEKYLKTTMHGMSASLPDYAMLVVDCNRGAIVGMTKEHLSIMLGLKVPFFVVMTKVDMASEENRQATLDALLKMLKRPGLHKTPLSVKNMQDVLTCVKTISGGVVTPIFQTSCVTGDGMDLIRSFLNHVPSRKMFESTVGDGNPPCVHIDSAFSVQGIGTVVSGVVTSGTIVNHATLLLGPDGNGVFVPVTIKGVQNKRVNVESVESGNTGSFAVKLKTRKDGGHLSKHDIRKGMALICPTVKPKATWQFKAEVLILTHPTTLKRGYSPILHCLTVRQSARIVEIADKDSKQKDLLRSGDRAMVTFEWSHRPEFLCEGSRIIFREGRTKGIGIVRCIMPEIPRTPPKNNKKFPTIHRTLDTNI
jgi:GTPase